MLIRHSCSYHDLDFKIAFNAAFYHPLLFLLSTRICQKAFCNSVDQLYPHNTELTCSSLPQIPHFYKKPHPPQLLLDLCFWDFELVMRLKCNLVLIRHPFSHHVIDFHSRFNAAFSHPLDILLLLSMILCQNIFAVVLINFTLMTLSLTCRFFLSISFVYLFSLSHIIRYSVFSCQIGDTSSVENYI